MDSEWFAPTATSSEMGVAALRFPWETTPLGPIAEWDDALRQAARLCFSTRFPVLITWGPELTMIYNDAYREFLGTEKRFGALGAPVSEVWAEAWHVLEDLFGEVIRTGVPTWMTDMPLVVNRSGYEEETYFTYSYSPLADSAGRIMGVLDIATETTEQVVSRRRLETVDALHLQMQGHDDVEGLLGAVADALAGGPDIDGCAAYLVRGDERVLVASGPTNPAEQLDPEVVEQVCRDGLMAVDGRVYVLPLTGVDDDVPDGVLVLEAGSLRPPDDATRSFMLLLASTVNAAIGAVTSHRAQLDVLRAQAELNELKAQRVREASITLQQSVLTPPPEANHLHTVVRYQPADEDLQIGGDWYDAFLTKDGATTVVVGDVTGHDLRAAAMMGQLRGLVRAGAYITGGTPAEVLRDVDDAIMGLNLGVDATATVVLARIEQVAAQRPSGGRTVRWSNAGHPYPLIIRASGEVEVLDPGNDLLLGVVRDAPRRDHCVELEGNDTLFLYTDGLLERRGVPMSESIATLVDALHGGHERTLDELSDHVLRTLAPGAGADDVALVLLRAFPEDEPRPAEAGPATVPAADTTLSPGR